VIITETMQTPRREEGVVWQRCLLGSYQTPTTADLNTDTRTMITRARKVVTVIQTANLQGKQIISSLPDELLRPGTAWLVLLFTSYTGCLSGWVLATPEQVPANNYSNSIDSITRSCVRP